MGKKQRGLSGIGCLGVILITIGVFGFIMIFIFMAAFGSKDQNPQKVGEVDTEEEQQQEDSAEDKHSNVFHVGDIVETDNFRITYESANEYKSNNEFIQPESGYVYWEFKFKFENISNSDQVVSSLMDWVCYADNLKMDQTYVGENNGLDASISAGRQTEGTVYFEIPKDAESIELEYDINYWYSDKIIFVGK